MVKKHHLKRDLSEVRKSEPPRGDGLGDGRSVPGGTDERQGGRCGWSRGGGRGERSLVDEARGLVLFRVTLPVRRAGSVTQKAPSSCLPSR